MYRKVVFFKHHFLDFYQDQSDKVQEKIDFILDLIQNIEIVPTKFLKHLVGTNGLYEIRIKVESNIYRVFCFFDKGRLILLINGFVKKSQKTPPKELKLALKLMKEYQNEKGI